MMKPERVAGMRVLFEQAAATLEQLAAATGYKLRTLASLAEKERWRAPPPTIADSDARVTLALQKRLDQLLAEADMKRTPAGHRAHTKDLLKLQSALRAQRPSTSQTALEHQERDDDELARLYQWIDDRILELASGIAAEVAAGQRSL
jgi:hypothetical protein